MTLLTVYTNHLRALLGDRKGVTALEYGLIAAAIVVAIATLVGTIGTSVSGKFSSINAAM